MENENTFAALMVRFRESMLAEGLSVKTVLWYRDELIACDRWLKAEGLGWGDMRRAVVEKYLAHCRAKGNAPATIAIHYRGLRGFFAWQVENGLLATSPLQGMKPPKVPRKAPRRAAVADFYTLLDAIPKDSWIGARDRLIINILFLCGLRREECAQLTADDFSLQNHLLLVTRGKTGARFVPLLPAVERAFVAYVYVRPAYDGLLLLSADGSGKPRGALGGNAIYLMLGRRCRTAGLPFMNPHSFRHGLAMYLLNEGGDMSLVQKVLGHAQITTTAEHYAEWMTAGMSREFAAKMAGIENRPPVRPEGLAYPAPMAS